MIIFGPTVTRDNHPMICYDNKATFSNITATYENDLFPATNMSNPSVVSRWESSSADEQYLISTFGSSSTVDYASIAGHNLGSSGALVSAEYFDGSSWIEATTPQAVATNAPLILRFAEVQAQAVRIKIGGTITTPTVAVFYAGLSLRMERSMFVGHSPINYKRSSNIITGMSENGQFIGRIKIGETNSTEVSIKNITGQFFRNSIEPFFQSAEESPFFFAWRPYEFPDETSFAWMMQNGRMQNQLPNGMVNIDFPIQGIISSRDVTTEQPTSRLMTISSDANNVNLRTEYDLLFPEPLDTTSLTVVIESGVTIGSASTATASLDVGTWPSGTTISMDLAGIIQGAGGAGGAAPDGVGLDGGAAITASKAITIDLANGGSIIDGAGGGAADTTNGGGGGSGSVGGAGGAADGGTAGNAGTATLGGTVSGNAGAGGAAGLVGVDSDAADGGDSGCTIDNNPLITVVNSGSGTIEGCNVNSPDFGGFTIDITTDQTDYDLRAAFDSQEGITPTGTTTVNCYVRNGVTISATDTATPAFDVGTWPSDATINLFVNGTIKGAGGAGGNTTNGAGSDGGDALVTTVPISIDFADQGSGADGIIASGGGGGEGGTDGGGGGGAGDIVGAGGTGTNAGSSGTATTGGAGGSSGSGSETQISQGDGTAIGDMTSGGGLAAAFDGNTSQSYTVTANSSGTTGYVGKTLSAPKAISKVDTYSTNNFGYTGGTSGSPVNISLYAKNGSVPANGTDGTLLGTVSRTESNALLTDTITSSDDTTLYDHVWIYLSQTGSTGCRIGEAEFYENVITADAGDGGNLGEDGHDNSGVQSAAGSGSAGNAIDGVSDVTKINAGDGTITGPEVN